MLNDTRAGYEREKQARELNDRGQKLLERGLLSLLLSSLFYHAGGASYETWFFATAGLLSIGSALNKFRQAEWETTKTSPEKEFLEKLSNIRISPLDAFFEPEIKETQKRRVSISLLPVFVQQILRR